MVECALNAIGGGTGCRIDVALFTFSKEKAGLNATYYSEIVFRHFEGNGVMQ